MELYIFRHGIAEDGRPGRSDSERELTDDGRKKTAAVLKTAVRAGVSPSLIMSSPYARALQTARIAAAEFGYKGSIVQIEALVPHHSPETVWNELREYRDETAILLAGHEPLLGHLVAYLLATPALRIEMKKSALVRVDVDSIRAATPHGILRWMITPKLSG
ncbi:MAG: phosphohistidine phosphatase SixA [Bryobacteraceae bacterium]|jgi:phosphohistidine phosphatase